MTTYANCSPTDLLQQNDVYRLSFVPSGLFASLSGSTTLGQAIANIYAAGSIDNITTFVQALNANPYQPGDMAETIDFLVESAGGAVSDMLNAILAAANQFSIWSSADFGSVAVSSCQRVVGAGTVSPGTQAADTTTAQAASQRATASTAAAASAASTDFLTNLESDLGTVGKYAVVAAGVALLFVFMPEIKAAGRAIFGKRSAT